MADFTIKPTPKFLIQNGEIISSEIVPVLDVNREVNNIAQFFGSHWLGKVHCEVFTAQYRLHGLSRATLPEIDTDLASEAQILAENLNFQNTYNHSTGHAVKLSTYERQSNDQEWIFAGSKLIYKTGLEFSTLDILYPLLSVNNVFLLDKNTQIGVKVEKAVNQSLFQLDYLMLKTALVLIGVE